MKALIIYSLLLIYLFRSGDGAAFAVCCLPLAFVIGKWCVRAIRRAAQFVRQAIAEGTDKVDDWKLRHSVEIVPICEEDDDDFCEEDDEDELDDAPDAEVVDAGIVDEAYIGIEINRAILTERRRLANLLRRKERMEAINNNGNEQYWQYFINTKQWRYLMYDIAECENRLARFERTAG